MHRLRRSRYPARLVGLVLGLALLLPEIGHSLAHRHAASHAIVVADHHHGEAAAAPHGHGSVFWAESHSAGAHPHLDQRPAPPSKVSLDLLLAARTVVEFWFDMTEPAQPSLPAHARLVFDGRYHGPPPPSRAPPLS
ncbi:MAG: hypothetical protein H0T68_05850 [Gemmatimonadales bacterium]|nr:hypothetical protein [Gemmatimonadales bacterium]